MASLWQDVIYALRMLRKKPGFTVIAVLTLAIGIGANTIMFSISDLLLFRPMKVKNPEQLACCKIRNLRYTGSIPYSAYLKIRDNNPVFSDIIAQDDDTGNIITMVYKDMTRKASTNFVSSNYFSSLGVVPIHGRGFLLEEELQGSSAVAMLSYRAWKRLGGEKEIVGQFVGVNGINCQVVGIMPEGFTGITVTGPDLWMSLGSYLSVTKLSRGYTRPARASADWNYPYLYLVGRIKPGLDMTAAQIQLQPIIPHLKDSFSRRWNPDCSFYLHRPPKMTMYGDGKYERVLLSGFSLILMGVSAIILIIACVNLANMMIIRGAGRKREIAIRLAMGGGRLHIIRQLLIESLLLALVGGVFGLIFAFWGTQILNTWLTNMIQKQPELGDSLKTGLNARVIVVTLAFSLVAVLMFGLGPALGLSRRDLVSDLKESGSSMLQFSRKKWGNLSVLCQITMAVVLVLSAALFTRSYMMLSKHNPGFRLDNKMVIEVDPLSAGYDRLRSAQVCQAIADHLESLVGVEALGACPKFYLWGVGACGSVYEYAPEGEGSQSRRHLGDYTTRSDVGRNYFSAMELPLLQGRSFTRLDCTENAEKVIIINESLARKLRPNGKALGCWIQYGIFSEYSEPYRVIGIVPNVNGISNANEVRAQTYKPVEPDQLRPYFYLRLANEESVEFFKQKISEQIHKVDPRVPILSVSAFKQKHDDNMLVLIGKCGAWLALAAGALALFLATLGIYTIKGYMVASRTPEIGIRKALGATVKDIVAMVFLEGLVLTVIGLILGLLLGLGATKVLVSTALYGISPFDPVCIVVSIVMLGFASLLAGLVPARRAAKIEPMAALRYE